MPPMNRAISAYDASSARRSVREQEADVFRRANGQLAAARDGSDTSRTRALADNARLWLSVCDLVRDPANRLPAELRAQLASVGATVQREVAGSHPDFDFLIAVNENVAAGLSAQPLP